MTERRNPPDIRDWSRLPTRVRLAGSIELAIGLALIVLLLLGAVTIGVVLAGLGCTFIALPLVFSSRLPWWPPESPVPWSDPITQNGLRATVIGLAFVGAGVLLTGLGIR